MGHLSRGIDSGKIRLGKSVIKVGTSSFFNGKDQNAALLVFSLVYMLEMTFPFDR